MSKYNKIDPALKERWLTALRSGEYKQGKGALETKEGCHCCLGVLAKIEGVPAEPYCEDYYPNLIFSFGKTLYNGEYTSAAFPPDDWRDLSFSMQLAVADMNDDGKSFAEIADFIEANF